MVDGPPRLFGADGRVIEKEGYDRVTALLSRLFAARGWRDTPIVGCSTSGVIAPDFQTEGLS